MECGALVRSPCICEGTCSEEPCIRNLACVRIPCVELLLGAECKVHVRVHVVRSSNEDPSEGPFDPEKDPLRT